MVTLKYPLPISRSVELGDICSCHLHMVCISVEVQHKKHIHCKGLFSLWIPKALQRFQCTCPCTLSTNSVSTPKLFRAWLAHWNSIQRNNPSYLSISCKDNVHLRNFHRNISAGIEALNLAGVLQATPTPLPLLQQWDHIGSDPSPKPSASN